MLKLLLIVSFACLMIFANSPGINHELQLEVVREFGFSDSYIRILRAVESLYSREQISWEELPHYIRFNRSTQGKLRCGDIAPNVDIAFAAAAAAGQLVDIATKSLSNICGGFETMNKPLIIAASRYYALSIYISSAISNRLTYPSLTVV